MVTIINYIIPFIPIIIVGVSVVLGIYTVMKKNSKGKKNTENISEK